MNYICFMFQTAIVSAGLFFSQETYKYALALKDRCLFYFFPLHIPVIRPDFRYLRSNRNT